MEWRISVLASPCRVLLYRESAPDECQALFYLCRRMFYNCFIDMTYERGQAFVTTQPIAYTVKRSTRARRVRIIVSSTGTVSIIVPHRLPAAIVARVIRAQEEWIRRAIVRAQRRRPRAFAHYTRTHYLEHRGAARQLAHARLAYFNRLYGFSYGAVSIRNQTTRWGSCSREGNLSFNYKIALLPEPLADYVIVHELCHRGVFNHSSVFWDLVSRAIPNHKDMRKQLRQL